MKNNFLCAVTLSVALAACGTAQKGALISANKALANQKYDECLQHLSSAETLGEFSESIHPQVLFKRGMCLEGLNRKPEAYAIYRVLIGRYPSSDWTAQAKARLDAALKPY